MQPPAKKLKNSKAKAKAAAAVEVTAAEEGSQAKTPKDSADNDDIEGLFSADEGGAADDEVDPLDVIVGQ